MPPLSKLLSKLNKTERITAEFLIEKILSLNWSALDIKKLKGHQNIFRVRKGKIRIIFFKNNQEIFIVSIARRCKDTYKF